jgi:hypothetical protein
MLDLKTRLFGDTLEAEEKIMKIHKELSYSLIPHKISFTDYNGVTIYFSQDHPQRLMEEE